MKKKQLTTLIGFTSFGLGYNTDSSCFQRRDIFSKTAQRKHAEQDGTNPGAQNNASQLETQAKSSPKPRTTPPPKPPRKELTDSTPSLEVEEAQVTTDQASVTANVDAQADQLTTHEEKAIELSPEEEQEVENETQEVIKSVLQQVTQENRKQVFDNYRCHESAFHKDSLKKHQQHTDTLLAIISDDHTPSSLKKLKKRSGVFLMYLKAKGKPSKEKLKIYQQAELTSQKEIELCHRKLNDSLTYLTANGHSKQNKNKFIDQIQNVWLEIYKNKLIKKSIKDLKDIRSIELNKLLNKREKKLQKIDRLQSKTEKYR
jgi:hypothetical protein